MARAGLLETEALYVADGTAVSTSLGEVDGDRVVHGLPAAGSVAAVAD